MRARSIARWVTIGIATLLSAPLLHRAWIDFQSWRSTTNDPSAKEAYMTFLQIDAGLLAIVIIAAVVVLGVLGARSSSGLR